MNNLLVQEIVELYDEFYDYHEKFDGSKVDEYEAKMRKQEDILFPCKSLNVMNDADYAAYVIVNAYEDSWTDEVDTAVKNKLWIPAYLELSEVL